METIAAAVISAILGVAGTLSAQRLSSRRTRHEAARGLVTCGIDLLDRVSTAWAEHVGTALQQTEAADYFSRVGAIFATDQERRLNSALADSRSLPANCIVTWQRLLNQAIELEKRHQALRRLVALPEVDDGFRMSAKEYVSQMQAVRRDAKRALAAMRKVCPKDAKNLIDTAIKARG